MANSYEVVAFRYCFKSLQDGLKHDLSEIVPRLFAENLISSVNRDQTLSRTDQPVEKAAHLLTVLESRIANDPNSFHSVVEVLHTCPTLQFIAKKMSDELEEVTKKGEQEHKAQAKLQKKKATLPRHKPQGYLPPPPLPPPQPSVPIQQPSVVVLNTRPRGAARPQRRIVVKRRHTPTNHLLHCIITIFCPWWIIIWLIVCCVYSC